MNERLHHLDALRALTMVLILPAHALALIGLRSGWNDTEASIFWTIHVFRLPLFFLVAGFFAALMLDRRGTAALVRNRCVRIGVPFVVGVLLVVPVLSACLYWASAAPNQHGEGSLTAFLTHVQPSYLWFLWYLALLYAAALAVKAGLRLGRLAPPRLGGVSGALLTNPIGVLLLAIPTSLLLYRQPAWMASTPTSFAPSLDLLAYYGVFFLSGWALFALPGLRPAIEARPGRYGLLALLALPPALALYLTQDDPVIGQGRSFHLLALWLLSIATWSIVLGLLGASRRRLSAHNPRLRFWADASYWIYLSHFVPMAALAAAIFGVGMPDALRVLLLVVATMALIFPAYGAFVRHGVIGRVLHGPRERTPREARSASPTPRALSSGSALPRGRDQAATQG